MKHLSKQMIENVLSDEGAGIDGNRSDHKSPELAALHTFCVGLATVNSFNGVVWP